MVNEKINRRCCKPVNPPFLLPILSRVFPLNDRAEYAAVRTFPNDSCGRSLLYMLIQFSMN